MRPISLLLVEDDPQALNLLRKMIAVKLPGVIVHCAEDGNAGIDLFHQMVPQLVITDINMPGLDGVSMAAEMKAARPETRIIVLTGYSDRMAAFDAIGITAYFTKPTPFNQLLLALEHCIAEILAEGG
jgi:YesN/AraC family two-component response regulator